MKNEKDKEFLRNIIGYRCLPQEILNLIFQYLYLSESVNAEAVRQVNAQKKSSGKESFFQKKIDEARLAYPLLEAVMTGHLGAYPEDQHERSLLSLLRTYPEALFMKGEISSPQGCDVYVLSELVEDLTRYKGHYVYIKNKQLMYIHYSGQQEIVFENADKLSDFEEAIEVLPHETIYDELVFPLTRQKIKEIVTKASLTGHKPVPHQRFFNISPFQLMHFYCDDDMIDHILRALGEIGEKQQILMRQQLEELGEGGADLIKVNRNPLDPDFRFEELMYYKTSYIVDYDDNDDEAITQDVTHALLENPDGLIYYKDSSNQIHWYRADLRSRRIDLVEFVPIQIPLDASESQKTILKQAQEDFERFVDGMELMENMSAKRSSRREHQLIRQTMHYVDPKTGTVRSLQLHQQGLCFELEGVSFKSSRYDFNRLDNAYRKCYRLYRQMPEEDHTIWCQEVGHIQKECFWLLLRLCQKNRAWFPFLTDETVDKNSAFIRTLHISNTAMTQEDSLIYDRDVKHFTPGLGSSFAVFKGPMPCGYADSEPGDEHEFISRDLIPCVLLTQNGKKTSDELRLSHTFSPTSRI